MPILTFIPYLLPLFHSPANPTIIMSIPPTVPLIFLTLVTFLFLLCDSTESSSSMQQSNHDYHSPHSHGYHHHHHRHHRRSGSSTTTATTRRPKQRRHSQPHKAPKESTTVMVNQTQISEEQFMRWVKLVGSLRHSVFKSCKNRVFPSFTLTVSKNRLIGDFTSIQEAVDSLPPINLVRVVIKVMAGTYTEKVYIPPFKSFVTIEGQGADKTIVQWGDTAYTVGPDGKKLGTFGSATFAVNSPFFIAKNITFQNTTPVPPPGASGKQAVAFRISADTAAFLGCTFLGAQDTLYDHLGRHYYKDCYIEGSVDFIFGNGLSLFQGCHVHAIAPRYGALTAQGRKSMLDDTGFSFVNCKVTGSGALYLGRAWGPFSRVVFAYTYLDDIIIPKGWYNWGDPNREMTVFYGQYKCTGQGANFAGRVAWSRELTDEEAKPFLSLSYIDGAEWLML